MGFFVPGRNGLICNSVLALASLAILLSFPAYEYVIKGGKNEPYHRGFFCNDDNIKYPMVEEQVSLFAAVGIWFTATLFVIVVVESICFWAFPPFENQKKSVSEALCCKIPMILLELYRLCGFWGIGSLFTLNITEIAKFEIGRLRPHFIAACNITLTEALCFEPNPLFNQTDNFEGDGEHVTETPMFENVQKPYTQIYKFVETNGTGNDSLCFNGDDKTVREARKSFLSGHASFSFYSAVFLVLYLQIRLSNTQGFSKPSSLRSRIFEGIKIFRPLTQWMLMALAAWITFTRISDYKHHPMDVFGGGVVGSLIAYLTIHQVICLPTYPRIFQSTLKDSNMDVFTTGAYDTLDGKEKEKSAIQLMDQGGPNELKIA